MLDISERPEPEQRTVVQQAAERGDIGPLALASLRAAGWLSDVDDNRVPVSGADSERDLQPAIHELESRKGEAAYTAGSTKAARAWRIAASGSDASATLLRWEARARDTLRSYSFAAERARRLDLVVGWLASILGIVAGASVLATSRTDLATAAQVAIGVLALAGGITALVHMLARFAEQAEMYRRAAAEHHRLLRELEEVRARGAWDPDDVEAIMERLASEIDEATRMSAPVLAPPWKRSSSSEPDAKDLPESSSTS